MIDRREPPHDVAEPPRRKHQRIAAGEDHFPDLRMARDIVERRIERRSRERLPRPGPTISRRKQKRQ